MDPILGQIILWPVTWVPEGWQLCDGTLLNVQQYQALFSLIGNKYGGNGQTTFAVPDLRNKFPIGTTVMNGVGVTGGAAVGQTTAIGVGQISIGIQNLPSHTHSAVFTPSGGGGGGGSVSIAIPAVSTPASGTTSITPGPNMNLTTSFDSYSASDVQIYSSDTTPANQTTLKPFTVTVPGGGGGGSVVNGNTGGGQALAFQVNVPVSVATVPPNLTLNYIIALEGVYPPRP